MNPERAPKSLQSRSGWVTAATLTLGATATVLLTDRGLWPKCPVYALTGFYCPGCGTLRGLEALLHGNTGLAFDQNALLPLIPLLGALGFLAQRIDKRWVTVTVICVTALLALSFTWLRNQPGSWMAPSF